MKTPEEYLIGCEHDGSYIPVNEVLRILTQIQKDVWNEALDKAAESVKMTGIAYGKDTCISDYEVDLDSILKLKL